MADRSANQRFKDLWETRVAWSTTGAVIIHAVLLGWVGWQVVVLPMTDTQAGPQLMLLPPSLFEGSGLEGRSTPVAREEVDAPEVDATEAGGLDGAEVGGVGDEDELMDRWAAAADRLGYRGLFRAEIVEADPDQVTDVEDEGEADSLSIGGLNAAAFAELSHGDSLDMQLDLDRLTELRPELAVMIPSMWILLRNPTAVESFLHRSYGRWTLDPNEPGSVTVTVWIDTKGSVEWAEVSRSSGRGNLDEAALALFNEVVTFRPARHEGVSVSGSATFALLFPW